MRLKLLGWATHSNPRVDALPPASNMHPQPSVSPRALTAIRAGQLIEAIKIIREENRLSLVESKRLVDRIQQVGADAVPGAHEFSDKMPLQATLALRDGDLIEAIKRYRAQSGCGLKQAKDAVEAYLDDDPLLKRQYDDARAERLEPWRQRMVVFAVLAGAVVAWLVVSSTP